MVWVARLGTGAGGRAGAKGGRGTDCRKGPEDEAGQETGREREGDGENKDVKVEIIMLLGFSLLV